LQFNGLFVQGEVLVHLIDDFKLKDLKNLQSDENGFENPTVVFFIEM
jgi:hypothetical protein